MTSREKLLNLVQGLNDAQVDELLIVATNRFPIPNAHGVVADTGRHDASWRAEELFQDGSR
ncbi:hypothetical protein [Fodinicola feengrottensis]|nr:hypothetical protein [Fodinicola feengrottensis]